MRRIVSLAAGVAALFSAASAAPITIDFNSLSAGDLVSNQFTGVSISGASNSNPGGNAAMVFDSNNPTGSDNDLAGPFDNPFTAPNEMLDAGNLLIISEDGDASDPDDDARGGSLQFLFDTVVTVLDMNIFDVNNRESVTLDFFDVNDALIISLTNGPLVTDDNEFFTAFLNIAGVKRMTVAFSSSGAIDDLRFDAPEIPVPAALPLLLTGLGLGSLIARKRKRAA